jgi:hypothetical protein
MVTSLALPSHRTDYKSPWTVFRNTIPPGFENASTNSRKSMQICDLLTSTCYFFDSSYLYPWFIELWPSFLALVAEICEWTRKYHSPRALLGGCSALALICFDFVWILELFWLSKSESDDSWLHWLPRWSMLSRLRWPDNIFAVGVYVLWSMFDWYMSWTNKNLIQCLFITIIANSLCQRRHIFWIFRTVCESVLVVVGMTRIDSDVQGAPLFF